MYQLLIVDDEPLVQAGIRSMLNWNEMNIEICGTAMNGQAALKIVEEKSPDIVITDIKMPGPDGLTMLAGLKSEFPEMQITVLTGYRDFSYAQEAIRLGVTRFFAQAVENGRTARGARGNDGEAGAEFCGRAAGGRREGRRKAGRRLHGAALRTEAHLAGGG